MIAKSLSRNSVQAIVVIFVVRDGEGGIDVDVALVFNDRLQRRHHRLGRQPVVKFRRPYGVIQYTFDVQCNE